MILKLYSFSQDKMGNIFEDKDKLIVAKVIIIGKEVVRTISINPSFQINGQPLDSDYRTTYNLQFLDKYNKAYINGNITMKYLIRHGVSSVFYVKVNFVKKFYLRLLFEQFLIQRIKGARRFIWELIVLIITVFVTWYTSKC